MKSSANRKVSFIRGDAKLMIFEASEEDDGEYKVEAVNNFGEATQTAAVTVNSMYMK